MIQKRLRKENRVTGEASDKSVYELCLDSAIELAYKENSMPENRDCRSDEFRAGLTRLPQLADPVICLNLEEELQQLHHAAAWNEASGRSAKTLAKYADFRIVLISMKAGSHMSQHQADGRISIQCLRGKLCIHLPSQAKAEMTAGQLLVLDCGIPHDVDAIDESAFLVTISWPGSHSSGSER